MALAPTKVELFERVPTGQEVRKLTLTASHELSLNAENGYTGRATSVRISGPAGSVVTVYDDQLFREGENLVLIEKLTDTPIRVSIATNFVPKAAQAGEGVYVGETSGFRWVFSKHIEQTWWRTLHGPVLDVLLALTEASDDPRIIVGGKTVRVIRGALGALSRCR
jgi:hypothetical protein